MADPIPARPLRVVMLVNLFMPEVYAGGEQQCLRLSSALREHGVEPVILTSRSRRETAEVDVMDGVEVHRLWSPAEPQKGGRHLGASLSWMRRVSRWIDARRDRIDLIHCHHAKLNAWIGTRAARRIGVPSIVKLGSAGPNFDFLSLEKKRFLYGRLAAQEIRRSASAFIGTSAEMMADLRAYGIEAARLYHIPNGVHLSTGRAGGSQADGAAIRAALDVAADERLVITAGRMERQKNIPTLLTAFAKATADGARARLVILGDGSLLPAHRRLATSLGLGERVRFEGRVERVAEYLGAADLFVLPALAEGMSNALLEAMAHGLPQVVSDVSGNADLVIEGRTGWLYAPPEDAHALAHALTAALNSPADKIATMGDASRVRVRALCAMETVAARHADLYRTLTDRRPQHAHAA
jgi:glycosyltransferase involved in cell wall biosynthesis